MTVYLPLPNRLDWRSDDEGWTLDVLQHRIRITKFPGFYRWSTNHGDFGHSQELSDAKETSTYLLRLTLEELDDHAALEFLNHLDDPLYQDLEIRVQGLPNARRLRRKKPITAISE